MQLEFCVFLAVVCSTQAIYLPPKGPAEYSYSLHQRYYAETTANASTGAGVVLNDVNVVGTQYWSKAAQSQRGVVSSGTGVDKGLSTAAINRISVTNYAATGSKGSLVTDYILQTCSYTANEGGASYSGDDNYRGQLSQIVAAGLPVHQENVTDWVYDGEHFGPVSIWMATPPTGTAGREETYTIVVTSTQPHVVVSYQVNGTEHLPSTVTGKQEPVQMSSVTVRRDFEYYNNASAWPPKFFDTSYNCPYNAVKSDNSDMTPFIVVMSVIAVVAIGFFAVLSKYLQGKQHNAPPQTVETVVAGRTYDTPPAVTMGDTTKNEIMV